MFKVFYKRKFKIMIKIFSPILLGLLIMTSCKKRDFLEQTVTNTLNEQSVFSDSARTMDALVGIYDDIGNFAAHNRFSTSGLAAASDEAEASLQSGAQEFIKWATGSISAINTNNDVWPVCYANIRRVNVFLKNIPRSPLSDALKERVSGEARFLRAWYYFQLVKHFGGVILLEDNVYNTDDTVPGKRNTYEQCVNYITSECDATAQILPLVHLSQDYGRITKGACLALKARMLLYAASPLFNGGQVATDAQLKIVTGYAAADNQRWLKAAQAAEVVQNLNEYQLFEDNTTAPGYGFYRVFTLRKNTEYIRRTDVCVNRGTGAGILVHP
jgi:hypothetical protein